MTAISRPELQLPWWLLIISGLAGIVIGFVVIAWPGRTALVFSVLLGIYLLIFGAVRFVWAIFDSDTPQRGLTMLSGALAFKLRSRTRGNSWPGLSP